MGRKKKGGINASELARLLPLLTHIAGAPSKSKNDILRQQKGKVLDLICQCMHSGTKNLRDEDFSKKDLKKLYTNKEKLRFLSDYATCSKDKKKCLAEKRKKVIRQNGQGIGIILSVVLPMLASVIYNHFKKKKKKKS